ncbi:MAG: hypothetical protein AMXMBFR56_37060 [Polyangiaceae bacterium]
MAQLNQDHLALLARHRDGIGRLMARSQIDPSKIVVLIAHLASPVGKSFIEAGLVPAHGRSSLVVPTGIEAAKMFTNLLDHPEVRLLAEKHRATAILVFDRRGKVGITFENFIPPQEPRDCPS